MIEFEFIIIGLIVFLFGLVCGLLCSDKEREELIQIGDVDDLEEAYGDTYSKEREQ